jgi:hypothetical protein
MGSLCTKGDEIKDDEIIGDEAEKGKVFKFNYGRAPKQF